MSDDERKRLRGVLQASGVLPNSAAVQTKAVHALLWNNIRDLHAMSFEDFVRLSGAPHVGRATINYLVEAAGKKFERSPFDVFMESVRQRAKEEKGGDGG